MKMLHILGAINKTTTKSKTNYMIQSHAWGIKTNTRKYENTLIIRPPTQRMIVTHFIPEVKFFETIQTYHQTPKFLLQAKNKIISRNL